MSRTKTTTKAREDFYNPDFPAYLTVTDALRAAPFLTEGVLKNMRYRRTGPTFVKPSRKTVGYPNAAFFEWLASKTVDTSATTRPRDTRPSTRKAAAR